MQYKDYFKNLSDLKTRELFWQLLHHKCLYYEYGESGTILSDQAYDKLEKEWEALSGMEAPVGFNRNDKLGKSIYCIGPIKIKKYLLDPTIETL